MRHRALIASLFALGIFGATQLYVLGNRVFSVTTGAGGSAGGGGAAGGGAAGAAGAAAGAGGSATGGVGTGGSATGGTGTGGTGTGGAGTGGAGTGGSATGGTGGAVGCGDGIRQDGELCDGIDLQSTTCALLGFTGGTLACSPSCQFNTSGCTGGTITPTIIATRTSCTAPCAVDFDATTTAGLSASDYTGANWSWDFDSTGTDTTAGHRITIGFNVGHVYDNPGTYVVTTRVHDLAGAAGVASTTITVSAMTGTTYYVSTSGSDSNGGTSMSAPFATLAKGLTRAGTNVTVLFRRGDTFNVGTTEYDWSSITGPCLFGAYTDPGHVSTAAPVFNTTVNHSGFDSFSFFNNVTDVRITDWNINASAGAYQVLETGTTSDLLFERVEISNVGETGGDGINLQLDNPASTRIFLVDSYFHDFDGIGIYADRPTQLSVIGTRILRYTNFDHGIRLQGGNTEPGFAGFANANYLADSDIEPTPSGNAFDSATFRGDHTNIVVVNNTFASTVSFAPQNDTEVEHVSKVLCEGNQINMNTAFMTGVSIAAQHVVVRNNVIEGTDVCIDVSVTSHIPANWATEIVLEHNTMYRPSSVTQGGPVTCINKHVTTGTLTARNNVWWQNTTFGNSDFLDDDGAGTTTKDHNWGYAPNVSGSWTGAPTGTGSGTGNPLFVSTTFGASTAFRLQSSSPLRNAGAATPVYQDQAAVTRPKESVWDIGAYEYAP